MKKSVLIIAFMVFFSFIIVGANLAQASTSCDLKVSLVNQDPYPAVQGDKVKLLFQVSGVQNPDCKGAMFKLDPEYSFSFADKKDSSIKVLPGGTYSQDSKNDWLIPYTLKVNNDALDGNAEIQVYFSPGTNTESKSFFSQKFNIDIQDSRADFEVHVKNYNPLTNILTFEILNIAKVDIKALTVEVPDQKNVQIKGSKYNIVGDLDSNEYTTADFEAIPKDGTITLNLYYTDKANVRREIQKNVTYESKYFKDRASSSKGELSLVTWIIVLAIVLGLGFWYYKRKQKKKLMLEKRRAMKK